MRLVLKTKDGYVKMYWISLHENSITGWLSGEFMRKELNISDDMHFDVHFTYPKDGNFHHSYKLMNPEIEEFISVYWDKVKIKILQNGNRKVTEMSRDEFDGNLIGHLVPKYKPDPIATVTFFQFTLLGFNIFNGTFKLIQKTDSIIEHKDIHVDDLVIDVSKMNNVGLNICALIREEKDSFIDSESHKVISKCLTLPNSKVLELRCMISVNKQASE